MSPRSTGILLVLVGLAIGAVGGASVSSLLRTAPASVTPSAPVCPPAPVCPICPMCPTAAAEPPVPTSTSADALPDPAQPEPDPSPPVLEPPPAALPGLPSQAIKIAGDGLRRELAECMALAREKEIDATVVIDLTITATSGLGRIRDLSFGAKTADTRALEPCVRGAARRVQFQWQSGEGESKLRYPVKFSR